MLQTIIRLKRVAAVTISLLNASLGIFAIYHIHIAQYQTACYFILIACLTDGLDGFCARRFHSASEFGKEIDSLCDLVSFGVAPGFLGYALFPNIWMAILFVLFVSSGIVRLAKFNVTAFDGYFRGTPITLNGFLIPLAFFCWPASLPIIMVILTITMNLPFKFKKIKISRKRKLPHQQTISV